MNAAQSIYAKFGTDKKLENEGIVLNLMGSKFHVRRAGGANRTFETAVNEKTRPYTREIAQGIMDTKLQSKMMKQVYGESVLLGWEDVYDRQGAPIVFTPDAFVTLMEELPELWALIRDEASNYRNFLEAVIDGENLGK